ncbi:type VII secretion integral membrane protein EccD [Mycobacteroides sp. LB1]|uniref:type VII secretion integral membrane protein EccD n=1 Tax=Mycobacteroides sp. LB1 TaxID=2750814 RepID=UPI0015DE0F0D|nr:type VII secretion integral membrane protein EccD [Mycobacteroides sp. LB1]
MTGIRELAQSQILTAAAEHVRVSVFGGRTQLDIALPLDLPIAAFVPELAKLVSSRDVKRDEDVTPREDRKNHWVLRRVESDIPLTPESTLRDAGIGHGDLLYLSSERTLDAPTLYDDVVDAAAKLNRSSYAPWDAASARIMGVAGLYLVSAAFVYFLVDLSFRPQWAVVAALSVIMVGVLLAGATVAYRSYERTDIASALTWASIPIAAGTCWAFLHVFGHLGVAGGCLAMLVFNFAAYRLVGTGNWGFLCSSVVFALCGLALIAQGAWSPDASVTGAALAVTATLLTLTVPWLTASLGRFDPPTADAPVDGELFENPFNRSSDKDSPNDSTSAESIPTAENARERVKMAVATRSALFSGLGIAAGSGIVVSLSPASQVAWAPMVLAALVAGVLGLRARPRLAGFEKASLGVPAVAITILTCVLAQSGSTLIGVVAFGVLLGLGVVAALVGVLFAGGRRMGRLTAGLAYVEYLMVASLIPVGLWVAGAYRHFSGVPW